jgi:hypothetical protein
MDGTSLVPKGSAMKESIKVALTILQIIAVVVGIVKSIL